MALDEDAEVMSNTHLTELLASEPPEVRDEIIRINTEARPIALQVALFTSPHRRSDRPVEFLPDEPPARYQTLVCGRGNGDGLTDHP